MTSLDHSEIVHTFADLINQSGNWIKAPFYAVKMYCEANSIYNIGLYRSCLFFIKTFFDFIGWIQHSLFAIIIFLLLLNGYSFDFLWIGIIILAFESMLTTFIVAKHKYAMENGQIMILGLLSILRGFVRSFALFSFLKQMMFGWYYDKGRKKYDCFCYYSSI